MAFMTKTADTETPRDETPQLSLTPFLAAGGRKAKAALNWAAYNVLPPLVMVVLLLGIWQVLCAKPGPGTLAADGRVIEIKGAKPLPSSD